MVIKYTSFEPKTGNTSQGEWKQAWSNGASKAGTIELPAGWYFKDNKVEVVLYSRMTAVSSWAVNSRGIVDISKQNLRFKLTGNYLRKTVNLAGEAEGFDQFIK